MCKISDFINQLSNNIDELQKEESRLRKMQSYYDCKISEIYHELEMKIFNKSQGNNIARELQTLLKKRRVVKSELDKYKSLRQSLGINQQKVNKTNHNLTKLKNKHESYIGSWNIELQDIEREYTDSINV